MASRVLHVAGLNNAQVWRTHHTLRRKPLASGLPPGIGSGPDGGLSPDDIAVAYDMKGIGGGPAAQRLAAFELAGYAPKDIAFYQNYFGLTDVSLQNIVVDGGVMAQRQRSSAEASIDIELIMAMAPPGSRVLVYQGPNTGVGFLDTLNRIVSDNQAKVVSCSWGASEDSSTFSYLQSEQQIFQQMAAQGQTFLASAGDAGAYDNGNNLSVDDPASQPYVVGVGGTMLALDAQGAYLSETTWNAGSSKLGAGGGGVSQVWSLPSYQEGLRSAASQSKRNVPDVSLDADPDTGYAIYFQGAWAVFGGTSAATPIWTSFIAAVNRDRLAQGFGPLGFLNPTLYRLARSTHCANDFHDIADGSNNLFYSATQGYDNATGWGSFNGANLLADLSSNATPMSTDPAVWMVAPNGGETLSAKEQFPVRWDSANIGAESRLRMYFSKNAGRTWTRIRSGLGIRGTNLWKPGKTRMTRRGLIKVCLPKSGKFAAICDTSDALFVIGKLR